MCVTEQSQAEAQRHGEASWVSCFVGSLHSGVRKEDRAPVENFKSGFQLCQLLNRSPCVSLEHWVLSARST